MTGATSTKPISPITPQQGTEGWRRATTGQAHASPEDHSGQQRVEPSLGEMPPPAGAAYDQLYGASSSYEEFAQYPHHSRGKASRLLLMAGIFIIGATVGVSTAWWFNRPVSGAALSSVEPVRRIAEPASASRNAQNGQRSTVRGISPSELPYDGAAPPNAVEQKTATAVAASVAKPLDAPPSNRAGAASRIESVDSAGSSKRLVPESVSEPETAPVASIVEPTPPVKPNASVKAEAPSAVRPRRDMPAKTVKDREIERIRQQVEDELKKKTERGRGIGEAHARSKSVVTRQNGQQLTMRTMLAKCDRASNFIRREQCKWRLCNGIWGKKGCPSYPQHSNSY